MHVLVVPRDLEKQAWKISDKKIADYTCHDCIKFVPHTETNVIYYIW